MVSQCPAYLGMGQSERLHGGIDSRADGPGRLGGWRRDQLVTAYEVPNLNCPGAAQNGLESDGPSLQHSPRLQEFTAHPVAVGALPLKQQDLEAAAG